MTENKNDRRLVTGQADAGVIQNISRQLRLLLRLLADKRVNFLVKLLPVGSLVYLLVPDMVPFILDDALVLGLGTYAFIELCPPEVVEEHRRALWGENGGETLDADYQEKKD